MNLVLSRYLNQSLCTASARALRIATTDYTYFEREQRTSAEQELLRPSALCLHFEVGSRSLFISAYN